MCRQLDIVGTSIQAQSLHTDVQRPFYSVATRRSPPLLGRERRWPRWIKKCIAYRYQATVHPGAPSSFLREELNITTYDDVIKWKHFPRYWPFVRGIHRSPVNSPHKGQWRGALMFSLIYARINGWANTGEAGDLRRHHAHYGVIVMIVVSTPDSFISIAIDFLTN